MELSSVKSLPPELIIEILSWLPLKSVLRCRCVSNLCYAATQEHEFIKKHRSRNRYPSKIPFTTDENGGLYTIAREESFRYLGQSQGLMLLETTHTNRQYRLWNPATEEMLNLPTPSKTRFVIRICVLPTTNQCKLVHVQCLKEGNTFRVGCEVLTVGTDSAWRPLEISLLDDVQNEENLSEIRMMSKVLYIIRVLKNGDMGDYARLICLEMGDERVTTIIIPRHFFLSDCRCIKLLKWKKKPSVASMVLDELHLWQLEDYKKKKWAEKKIVISLIFLNEYPNMRDFYHVRAKGDELTLHSCSCEILTYNVQSQKVKFTPLVPSRKFKCSIRPSLATTFQGNAVRRETKRLQ